MRILHIAKYYEPFKGGIEKMIMELAEGSVKAGHEVVVLSSNWDRRYREDEINGVKVIRLPRLGNAFSQPMAISFLWQIKKWQAWADLIQVHTPHPLAEMSFLWQDNKTPMIATYHCDVVRQKRLHKIYQPVNQKLLDRADRIVVSTPNHLKFSPALQSFHHKAAVIPFGIRAKHANKTLEINEKMKAIKEELGDYFLFVGRLVPYKGVDYLLKAMQKTKEKLVVIGQGPRWEDWYHLANDLGIQDRVRLLGKVDDDSEFAAYMHGCHSLVLPSVDSSEAFGIVLIEAMSCGKPVITTDLPSGVPWVNQKGVTGLEVQPKNSEQLTEALNTIATDHQLRQSLGENALKRFQQYFQADVMVNSYLELYQDCLGKLRQAA